MSIHIAPRTVQKTFRIHWKFMLFSKMEPERLTRDWITFTWPPQTRDMAKQDMPKQDMPKQATPNKACLRCLVLAMSAFGWKCRHGKTSHVPKQGLFSCLVSMSCFDRQNKTCRNKTGLACLVLMSCFDYQNKTCQNKR